MIENTLEGKGYTLRRKVFFRRNLIHSLEMSLVNAVFRSKVSPTRTLRKYRVQNSDCSNEFM